MREGLEAVLDDLGLSKPPAPRWETGGEFTDTKARELVNFKKLLAFYDPLDTAAFAHYIPNECVIDQSIDTRAFTRGWSRCLRLPLGVEIPTGPQVNRALGITAEPNAQNHYIMLASDLRRYYTELGPKAMGPPLVCRVGDKWLGLVMKFDLTPPDGEIWSPAASWALLGERRMPKAVAETDDEARQLGLN